MNVKYAYHNNLHVVYDIKQNHIIGPSLPISNNIQPVSKNANILSKTDEKYVHIIIADVGLNIENSKKVMKLPTSITLGISPYGYNLSTLSKTALDAGYNLLLYLPLEPTNLGDDAGSYALLTSNAIEDNIEKLKFLASKVNGILGFYAMPREKFTLVEAQTSSLLEFVKSNNLLFVYGTNNEASNIKKLSNSLNIPFLAVDLVLDEDLSSEGISRQFEKVEKILNTNGKAIIIGRSYPLTIEMIEQWITTLYNKKIILVNVKDFVAKNKKTM